MKNKKFLISIIAIFVVFITLTGVVIADKYFNNDMQQFFEEAKKAEEGKNIVVVVEGKNIYQETIDFLVAGKVIEQKMSSDIIGIDLEPSEVNESEILKKQIRNAVVLSEAEKLGLDVSYQEAKEYTEKNFEIIKRENGPNWEFLVAYMKELNLTEKQYLERAIESDQNTLTRAKLYENFIENKSGSYDDLVAEYEKYVEELIKKADIKYMN